jgi:hypothetical protein
MIRVARSLVRSLARSLIRSDRAGIRHPIILDGYALELDGHIITL